MIGAGTNPGILDVLVVEDSPQDAELVEASLRKHSIARFRCLRAGSLAEGLDLLRHRSFDAVLLDLGLPDSKGLAGLDRIHGEKPELPVIVLTGQDDEKLALEAIDHGAREYLVKDVLIPQGPLLPRTLFHNIFRKKVERDLAVLEDLADPGGGSGALVRGPARETLDSFKEILLSPVFPDEFDSWIRQLVAILNDLAPRMERTLVEESGQRFQEWEERAPHLGSRIRKLRRIDEELWNDFRRLASWVEASADRREKPESFEGGASDTFFEVVEKGLRFLIRYERQRATIQFWAYEVLARDDGGGD